MRLLYAKYENIAQKVKDEKLYIVIYGAGMIGSVVVPFILQQYELLEHLLFYLDASERKQREKIKIGNCEYEIKSPDNLRRLPEKTVIFITNSNYSPVIRMMDEISELDQIEGYLIPVLQVCASHEKKFFNSIKITKEPMIPKKIHYCWFSGNPIPERLKKCIDSWHRFCPDYEIFRWDESNYDVNKNLYMRQAYEAGKWGFVPDIARLDILYEHGGIYLDTDVELLRGLDDLLFQPAFAGVEKWGNVNMGGCSGAIAKHPVIKQMLDFRKNERFILEDGCFNQTTCGYYETEPLMRLGMKPNNRIQIIEGMTVYSSDFFHPYDYMSGEITITDNTYSIHHFNGGWLDDTDMEERKNTMSLYKQILERMHAESL